MLFEPGPGRYFTDAELPPPTRRGELTALVARDVGEIGAVARELQVRAGALAPATTAPADLAAATDLAIAAAEHDRQSRESDSAGGAVAADAGALEGVLAGLTNELASELSNASLPAEPSEPEDSSNEDWKDPEYREIIREWYLSYLGREPEDGILDDYYHAQARLVDVLAGILNSDEYRARQGAAPGAPLPPLPGAPAPLPPPPAGEGYEYSNGYIVGTRERLEAYANEHGEARDRIAHFLDENPGDEGRAPAALELGGWNDFIISHGL